MSKNNPELYFLLFNEISIISQLSRAFMDARLPKGLQTSHFGVLNHLIRVQDGRTPLELAKAFQVPKTTMTHTLSGLEEHEFIKILPNKKDGRSKIIWLTEKGRRFRDQAIMDIQPDLSRILDQLPPESMASLVSDLMDIRKIMDSSRD